MGAINCTILPSGWDTEVKEVWEKITSQMKVFGHLTLKNLGDFAVYFARKVSITGDEDFQCVITKEVLKGGLTVFFGNLSDTVLRTITNGQFLDFCNKTVQHIAQMTATSPTMVKEAIRGGIREFIDRICGESCSPIVKTFFECVWKRAEEKIAKKAAGSAMSNVVSSGAATVKTVGKNASKLSKAKACAGAALKSSVIVDGALLGVSAGYSYYKYKNGAATWEEHKEVVVKRSAGTAGSIGGTTAGAFIGSLIFPGVGTFVGGFVGGLAGDYAGSRFGGKVYNGYSKRLHVD